MENSQLKYIQIELLLNEVKSLISLELGVNPFEDLEKTIKIVSQKNYNQSHVAGIWKTKFDDAITEFAQKTNNWTTKLTNQELLQLKMYKLNKEWAQHLIDDGYTILDMGDFNNLGFSAFYSMEKATIFK